MEEDNGSTASTGKDADAALAKREGLGIFRAAFFITGLVAGSGMLALANAVTQTGWIGMVMLVYFGANSAFCGYTLSRCWLTIEARYPELQEQVRAPYPEICYRAFGNSGKIVASVALFINQIGTVVVYVLLSADLVTDLFANAGFELSSCLWILIIAALLCPCTFLGSPKDFWFIGATAVSSTALAWLSIIIHLSIYYTETSPKADHTPPTFYTLFLGTATILFSFGGASAFPTIQNDMADRTRFATSVALGYIGLICLYFPLTLLGYLALGDQLQPDLINSLYPNSFFKGAAQVLFMLNLTSSLVGVTSPVYQQIEDVMGVPTHFNWKRVAFRTSMMCLIVLVGETIPSFGKILNLIGGSTLTLMTFIFPPLLFLKLASDRREDKDWRNIEVPAWERILLCEIILIATFGGCASTYSAVADILDPASITSSCLISV